MADAAAMGVDEDRLHVRLLQVRATTLGAWWRFEALASDFWRLWCNDRDGAAIVSGDRRIALPARRLVLIPAGVVFSTRPSDGVLQRYIHFDPLALAGPTTHPAFRHPVVLGPDPLGWDLMRRLPDDASADDTLPLHCLAKAAVYYAIGGMLAVLPEGEHSRCLGLLAGWHPLSQAVHAMENALAEPHPVADLARACGMSRTRFFAAFRRRFGETPRQYLLRRRIARAAQLLEHTSMGIDRIASASGFANRYYFTRVFSRLTRDSPAAWRARPRP